MAPSLAQRAELLLMDEQFSRLTAMMRVDRESLLLILSSGIRLTIIVNHDLDEAPYISPGV